MDCQRPDANERIVNARDMPRTVTLQALINPMDEYRDMSLVERGLMGLCPGHAGVTCFV